MSRIDRKYIERLQVLQRDNDEGYAHIAADRVLCDLLIELSYTEVVDEWEKLEKWYA